MATILIIDDDTELRTVLRIGLMAAGYTVDMASNGQEGLNRYRAEPADLVLTDMVMPGMEGVETILALRREFPGLGIIAMSGGTTYSAHWLALAGLSGACHTLVKPFELPQLLTLVTKVLLANPDPLCADVTRA